MGLMDWMKKGKQIAAKDMTPEQLTEYVKNLEASSAELEKHAETLDAREKELNARADEIAKQEKALEKKKSGSNSSANIEADNQPQKELTDREKKLKVIEEHHPFAASVRLDRISDEVIEERYETACEIKKHKAKK